MNVLKKAKAFINSVDFLIYLFGISLSTLLVGYAPSSISIGLFFLFSLRYYFLNKVKLKLNLKLLLPIILYFLFLLSLLWTEDQEQTLKGLQRMVALALIPIAFWLIPKVNRKHYHIVLRLFVNSNAILGLFFLVVASIKFMNNESYEVFTYHSLVEVLDLNAIYVSMVFCVSLFYLLALKKKTKLQKVLIVFFVLLLFLLSSKTIALILLISLIIALKKLLVVNKKNIILIIITSSLLVGLGTVSLYKRFSFEKYTEVSEVFTKKSFGKVYYWTGSSIRLFQLRLLKEQIEQEKILLKGFGLFASKDNLKERHTHYNTYPGFHAYNYHNQYAQILSETGLVGLLVLLALLITMWSNAIKRKDFFYIMLCVMFTTIFLTESVLWRQRGLLLFISFYTFLLRKSSN